jgi:hypothetical protein
LGDADDAFERAGVTGAEERGEIELARARDTGLRRARGLRDAEVRIRRLDQALPATARQCGPIGLGRRRGGRAEVAGAQRGIDGGDVKSPRRGGSRRRRGLDGTRWRDRARPQHT